MPQGLERFSALFVLPRAVDDDLPRGGRRTVAYWHTRGSGRARVAIGAGGSESVLDLGGVRYLETDLARDAVRGAFVSAREFELEIGAGNYAIIRAKDAIKPFEL